MLELIPSFKANSISGMATVLDKPCNISINANHISCSINVDTVHIGVGMEVATKKLNMNLSGATDISVTGVYVTAMTSLLEDIYTEIPSLKMSAQSAGIPPYVPTV